VCFTLIGQIVNRYMVAARYQPTWFVIVNSPVETPSLAKRVRADWAGVGAEELRTSLLTDLHMPLSKSPSAYKPPAAYKQILANNPLSHEERQSLSLRTLYAGALRRLRFYYPQTYAALSGDDLAKRQAFEKDEAEMRAAYATARSPDKFIDDLTTINCPLPGVSDKAAFGGFLAEDASMEAFTAISFEQDTHSRVTVPCRSASVRNIMRFGLTLLPTLIRHLDDKRPTKLVIGDSTREPAVFGGKFFADEYDARHQTWPLVRCSADTYCEKKRPFDKPYTVKVGDICFVLIGQIVNRQLNAVRYQPTAIVLVNSPIETPMLADRVKAEWSGIDSEGLKSSLLADLHTTTLEGAADTATEAQALKLVHSGALRRLRYYFPDAYASLTRTDLENREEFEKAERESGK
jgi:hypothetical protein